LRGQRPKIQIQKRRQLGQRGEPVFRCEEKRHPGPPKWTGIFFRGVDEVPGGKGREEGVNDQPTVNSPIEESESLNQNLGDTNGEEGGVGGSYKKKVKYIG